MAIATVNSSTQQLINLFESLTGAEIEAKLQRAADTFRSYRKTPFGDRARWMPHAAAILEGEKEAYAQSDDHGNRQDVPLGRGSSDEVCVGLPVLSRNRGTLSGGRSGGNGSKAKLHPLPATRGQSCPSGRAVEFSVLAGARFAAPALMAGNVGLLKHASTVPQIALLIEELFRRAGFPEGAFQTLLIGSREVDGILGEPRVMAATLTGSETRVPNWVRFPRARASATGIVTCANPLKQARSF
jgi:succinate-semialdehyde dehydrogenase/glutarate-semialdehyde dehydrogenase